MYCYILIMCLLTVIFPYSFGDILAKWWIMRYNNNDYEYEYEYEYDRSFRKRQIQMEENHTDQYNAYKRVFKYRHYPSPLSKIDPSVQSGAFSNSVSPSQYPPQQLSSFHGNPKSKISRKRKIISPYHFNKPTSISNGKIGRQNVNVHRSELNSRQISAIRGSLSSTMLVLLGATAAGFLDIFDEDLANIIESVDLSTSPLSPLSGFQDILISLLRGINQLSAKRY